MELSPRELTLASILSAAITLSVIAVFASILVDFIKYDQRSTVKESRRSIVATGSMIGFYMVYYLLLRSGLSSLPVWNPEANADGPTGMMITLPTAYILGIAGTLLIVAGAVINILGRLQLGKNWSNHIKIYHDHTLVQNGVYRAVRHPLYASIMLMLFGGSLAYRNSLSAALTLLVFIPFMHYRARQEEALLREDFTEYEEYMKNTGMFFPKIRKLN